MKRALVAATALGAWVACEAPEDVIDEEELAELADEDPPEGAVTVGSGSYEFTGTPLAEERPVPVWYHVPEDLGTDATVALVIHGAGRNAGGHRDAWVEPAEEHGFVVAVPEFANQDGLYPGAAEYNLGRLEDDDGEIRPRDEWTYSVLEPLFDDFVARAGLETDRYHIYGHSAGSQVTHRFLTLFPEARAERVVLANAGWYTQPVDDVDWPYGLGHAAVEEDHGMLASPEELRLFFQRDVTVLLGEDDDDPGASALRGTAHANAQGAHRFERGHTYFEVVGERAKELGVELRWQLDTVPEVGHSNASMAPAAAEIIGDG